MVWRSSPRGTKAETSLSSARVAARAVPSPQFTPKSAKWNPSMTAALPMRDLMRSAPALSSFVRTTARIRCGISRTSGRRWIGCGKWTGSLNGGAGGSSRMAGAGSMRGGGRQGAGRTPSAAGGSSRMAGAGSMCGGGRQGAGRTPSAAGGSSRMAGACSMRGGGRQGAGRTPSAVGGSSRMAGACLMRGGGRQGAGRTSGSAGVWPIRWLAGGGVFGLMIARGCTGSLSRSSISRTVRPSLIPWASSAHSRRVCGSGGASPVSAIARAMRSDVSSTICPRSRAHAWGPMWLCGISLGVQSSARP